MLDVTISQAQVQELRSRAHHAVNRANKALTRRTWSDPVYIATRRALDALMIKLHQAKWSFGALDGTYADFQDPRGERKPLENVAELFEQVEQLADRIAAECLAGRQPAAPVTPKLETHGSEVLFADGVPLVPTICPVVIVGGGNQDMGRQYAKQVIEVYGAWIFKRQATRRFSDVERAEIAKWETHLAAHMPEVLDFARGWADGATASGLAMTYEQALAIWTGTLPPATKVSPMALSQEDGHTATSTAAYLGVSAVSIAHEDMCSGVCAWGDGTRDGELVTGSTTDHDCTYQATIVAFPTSGNAFVYTPFSANGSIPVLGRFFMAGHPGMNSKGLAYVHHGGANSGEPKDQWGYGVRRGPATFHLLQFADNAPEARDAMLRWPVGDTAISLGTAGGLFADRNYGVSVEARAGCPDNPDPIMREASYDALGKPFSFLYANNNALDPRSSQLNSGVGVHYDYSLAGGWFTFDPKVIFSGEPGDAFRRLNTKNSEGRNRFHYEAMMRGYGRIDAAYMSALYRESGSIPQGDYDEVCKAWNAGAQWDCSPAHRANAFTVVMEPRSDGHGRYHGCVGPANRALACRDPGHGYYYYDETNAFWTLTLAPTPEGVLAAAADVARTEVRRARQHLGALEDAFAGRDELSRLLAIAEAAAEDGERFLSQQRPSDLDEIYAHLARATRAFTRAQVRARQVIEAIVPPRTSTAGL